MKPTITQHNIVTQILGMPCTHEVNNISVETFKDRSIVYAESEETSFEFYFLGKKLIFSFSEPQQEEFYECFDIHYHTHRLCPKPLRKERFDSILNTVQ